MQQTFITPLAASRSLISWVPGQPSYEHVDLTVAAVIPLATGKPSALMFGNTQHVVYRGQDNVIHEVYWQ